MKPIFLYAGQGSQRVGMGVDLYREFAAYRQVIDELSPEIKTMMHEGELSELSRTENTQCCMAAFAAGVTAVLREAGIFPQGACGLSLGEYGALHAAGVFGVKEYVDITRFRGRVMAEAAEGKICSMSAVMGSTPEVVEEACRVLSDSGFLTLANYNCPGQHVICGEEAAVAKAEAYLKEKGVKRCIRLNVSGPFHTKYMEPAARRLGEFLKDFSFRAPEIPVALNVTGEFYNGTDDLKENLVAQVQSSVHFQQCLEAFLKQGADTFIEIGPGKALSGFLKKTAKEMGTEIQSFSIDTAADLYRVLEMKEEIYG